MTERITIELPSALAEAIQSAISSGEFVDQGDVVRDALRTWRVARDEQASDIETLKLLITEGLDSGEPIEADDAFARLDALKSASD